MTVMVLSAVAPYLAAALLPLALLGLSRVFRWFYLRSIAGAIYSLADSDPGEFGIDAPAGSAAPLQVRWQDPAMHAESAAPGQLDQAVGETRAMRAAFVISAAVYTLLAAIAVWRGLTVHGMGSRSALAVASINTAPAVILTLAFIRASLSQSIVVGIIWVALQFAVLVGVVGTTWRTAGSVLAAAIHSGLLIPILGVGLLALRTLRPLIAGFVAAVIVLIVISASLGIVFAVIGVSLDGTPTATGLLPFAGYAITLYTIAYSRYRTAAGRTPKRMLLLRVFHQEPIDSWLIDVLDDSWRRVGRIDLVVGVDLALRTLNALALESFLLGRVHRQFLKNEIEVRQRLSSLPEERAVDGRYPLNEIHCQPNTWRSTVIRLASAADVVLMDLRGFQRANTGARFELEQVIQRVLLPRIVVLADRTTDQRLLAESIEHAWSLLPAGSPNANVSAASIDVIRCSAARADNTSAIVRSIFAAAFGVTTERSPEMVRGGA